MDGASFLVAHRGWARRYPENTLSAVEFAALAGARFVEVDVQLSADRVPFLFHDRTLDRICGVPGSIGASTSEEVGLLRARERGRFGEKFADEPVATLVALAARLSRHPDVRVFVELKRAAIEAFGATAVLDAVLPRLGSMEDRCTLISYDLPVLAQARERSRLPVGAVLVHWQQRAEADVARLEPDVVFCDVQHLPPTGPLEVPHGDLAVFEVDDPYVALELVDRGARFVETFDIGGMLKALASRPGEAG